VIRSVEERAAKGTAALVAIIEILKPTEEADICFLLDLLESTRDESDRRAGIKLFRSHLIQVAALEMYDLQRPVE
jgi:hypothetical protein